MTKRAIRRSQAPIDPMFFIPDDVDELVYEDTGFDEIVEPEDGFIEVIVEVEDGGGGDDGTDYNETPETPQVLDIVPPQIIRMGDDGSEVVDVIFEVSEVDADTYEFRVTKI